MSKRINIPHEKLEKDFESRTLKDDMPWIFEIVKAAEEEHEDKPDASSGVIGNTLFDQKRTDD